MELDFEDVLLDVDITDLFNVKRRPETITSKGRSSVTEELIEDVAGVVTMAGPNDLDRLDDADRMGRVISVVTKFQLRGPSKESGQVYKPDIVVWKGDEFVVKTVDPYGHVGGGFVQALAGSVDIVDEAPFSG